MLSLLNSSEGAAFAAVTDSDIDSSTMVLPSFDNVSGDEERSAALEGDTAKTDTSDTRVVSTLVSGCGSS